MGEFELELGRLVARLRTGSASRWSRPGVAPLIASLADVLVTLAGEHPGPVPLPRPHAYADLIQTLADDLAATSPAPAALARATDALAATRRALP